MNAAIKGRAAIAEAEYEYLVPVIRSAVFSPNPANINQKTVLSVEVIEETVILKPYYYYSNDIFSGEV